MRTKQRGFTLLELVVTLIILGLMLSMGLPAMSRMMQSNNVRQLSNELVRDLNLARSHASDLNKNVSLCRRQGNTQTCRESGAEWHTTGWFVFVDETNDRVPDTAGEFIRIADITTTAKINHTSVPGALFNGGVSFFADGTVRDSNNKTTTARFDVCPNGTSAVNGKTINIDERGNIRTSVLAASEC